MLRVMRHVKGTHHALLSDRTSAQMRSGERDRVKLVEILIDNQMHVT